MVGVWLLSVVAVVLVLVLAANASYHNKTGHLCRWMYLERQHPYKGLAKCLAYMDPDTLAAESIKTDDCCCNIFKHRKKSD